MNPRRFKIKDQVWRVFFKSNLKSDENEPCFGVCDYESRTIYIDKGLSKEKERETIIHEFIHAVMHECHIDLGHDMNETVTDSIAHCLTKSFDFSKKR